MNKAIAAIIFVVTSAPSWAQMTPEGLWRNIDDKTGEAKAEIRIQANKAGGKDVWEGGKILDPENGRNYTLRMTPVEGGKKLEVRGSFGPFGRTQTWVRVQ